MDSVLVLVFLLVLLVSYLFLTRPKNLPPGRFTIPYIGTIGLFWRLKGRRPHDVFMDEAKALGSPIFRFSIANQRFVVLNGYDAINEAFVKNADTCSGRVEKLRKLMNMQSPNEGKQP